VGYYVIQGWAGTTYRSSQFISMEFSIMIRRLFFTAALLMPGLAYSANPSANLTVQIVPGSDPAVPAPAVAAGFTTLIANLDFQNNQVCVGSSCVAASPVTNWLDCSGNDTTKLFHKTFYLGASNTYPCNIDIVQDPSTSTTALDLQYLTSYPGTYGSSDPFGIKHFVAMSTATNGSTISFTHPSASFYFEASYRIDNNTDPGSNASGPDGVWESSDNSTCDVDLEPAELWGSSGGFADGGSGVCNVGGPGWQSYNEAILPSGWSVLDYHKYAALRTTNGTNSVMSCPYVDDILVVQSGGACGNTYSALGTLTAKPWVIAWVGGYGPPTYATLPAVNMNLYIRYIRIWACATLTNGQCPGSTLTNNGAGLQYWHN
jgi:hypothetical protein